MPIFAARRRFPRIGAYRDVVHRRIKRSGTGDGALLHVRTLGELRLEADEGAPPPLRRKPLALLAYVARRAPRPASRTELATLFWGERGEDRARQSLRQTLLELTQSLGEHLEVDPESVRIVGTGLELDIAAFERDVAGGDFRSAIERWKGDFFDGSEDIGGEEFRRWIEGERVALHRQLSGAMQRMIGDAEIRGDWAEACTWAEQWASALQFDEAAHLRLVEARRVLHARAAEVLVRRDVAATAERSLLPYHLARTDQFPVKAPVRPRHEVWQGRVGTAIAAIGIAALVIVVVVQLGLFHLPSAATRK
jgi:DNA-binding SARP family transcriptional activator